MSSTHDSDHGDAHSASAEEPSVPLSPSEVRRINELMRQFRDAVVDAIEPELPEITERIMKRLRHRMDAFDRKLQNPPQNQR